MYGIIYKITNLVNGKVYIGQTTRHLRVRISEHFSDRNKHNRPICKAFLKYGKDSFKFEKLDDGENREDLDNKERMWVSFYKSNVKGIGYNLDIGGYSGQRYSEERKQYYSEMLKGEGNPFYGKKHSEETIKNLQNQHGIKVLCLTNNTVYESCMEVQRQLGVDNRYVNNCINNKQKSAKGYKFQKAL